MGNENETWSSWPCDDKGGQGGRDECAAVDAVSGGSYDRGTHQRNERTHDVKGLAAARSCRYMSHGVAMEGKRDFRNWHWCAPSSVPMDPGCGGGRRYAQLAGQVAGMPAAPRHHLAHVDGSLVGPGPAEHSDVGMASP